MTAAEVLKRWTRPRSLAGRLSHELTVRESYDAQSSYERWLGLRDRLAQRRKMIRMIARMRRRKMGLPFSEHGGLRRW